MKLKIKIFFVIILAYLGLQSYFYTTFEQKYTNNVSKYNIEKTKYNSLVKDLGSNITKLNQTDKQLEQFQTNKQRSSIFYTKDFLEWILPNNNQTKSFKITADKDKNIITYESSSLKEVLELLNKIKQLKSQGYIQNFSYGKIGKVKILYIVKITLTTQKLKDILSYKLDQDYYLFKHISIIKK